MVPSILVVDDEVDMAATYQRLLRRKGYRVIAAGTRQEALLALESERPELVVADVHLPDGDGLDIVRAARTGRRPPPVVVVTGFASEQGRRRALEAGATAYLAKPFSLVGFVEVVESILRAPGPTRPAAGGGRAVEPAP